jgi:hypothetical protein
MRCAVRPLKPDRRAREKLQPGGKRGLIRAFGDEIAPDLADQIDALRTQDVGAIEFRAAWGTNVIDLGADELARAHQQLTEAEIAVSAIGSPSARRPSAVTSVQSWRGHGPWMVSVASDTVTETSGIPRGELYHGKIGDTPGTQ